MTRAADRGGRRRSRRAPRLTSGPRRLGRRSTALLLALALVLATAAGAFAYWTGSGAGSTSTMLPDLQQLSFSPGTPTAQLYPGGSASVAIVAHNPNAYFVQIPSLQLDAGASPAIAVDAGRSGCDVSALSFSADDQPALGWSVPPKVGSTDGTLTIDLPAAMLMSTAAANACQGATFTVALVAPA